MKKVLSLVLAAVFAASLSACGGALVDLDTPKSEELTAQYDFYPDAMNTIRADMKITPEQADEVFIILTSCGLDGKITSISESNGAYTVYYGGSSLDVALSDGAVEAVYSGRDMLYPEYHKHNVLMDYDLTVKDVKTGSGDKIGEYAYIRITKAQLQAITEENYKEFVETVVKDSGYNWVAILCDDGTGICFPGTMSVHTGSKIPTVLFLKITALSRWTKTAAIHTNSSERQESKSDGHNARRFLYAFSCSASAAA